MVEDTNVKEIGGRESVEIERYKLPPRENQGRSPKIYNLERELGKSRYPVANVVRGRLSNEARAFTMYVYTEEIPSTVKRG